MKNGIHIISGDENGTIIITHLHSHTVLFKITQHMGPIKHLNSNEEGTTLISIGSDDTMIIWNFDLTP